MSAFEVAALSLVSVGALFLLVGSIGIVRLPDFYARTHAAGKSDTLGLMLVLAGLGIHEGLSLNTAKLAAVMVFVALTGPVGIHALARAAYRTGLEPWFRGRPVPRDSTERDGSPAAGRPGDEEED